MSSRVLRIARLAMMLLALGSTVTPVIAHAAYAEVAAAVGTSVRPRTRLTALPSACSTPASPPAVVSAEVCCHAPSSRALHRLRGRLHLLNRVLRL